MTPQLWIGLGFLAAVVAFLMVAFFVKANISAFQHDIIHYLAALCAGFAGGFLCGDAVLTWDQTISTTGKLAFEGTAGFGLFALIWTTFPKWTPPKSPPPPDRFCFSVPDGWTFRATVDAIAKVSRGIAHFEGFTDEELSELLPATEFDTPSAREAIANLRYRNTALPDYTVNIENGIFHIRTES